MNGAVIGWALAATAVVAGYVGYGVRGLLLAFSVIAFWLLLQFSRAVRALRDAAGGPIGQVPNAVMLNSRLRAGMRLADVLKTTRSLGRKLADDPETFAWADAGGDEVHVELRNGVVRRWELRRAAEAEA